MHPVGASDSSQGSSQMHEHTALLLSRIVEASPQAAMEVHNPSLCRWLCSVTALLLLQCVPGVGHCFFIALSREVCHGETCVNEALPFAAPRRLDHEAFRACSSKSHHQCLDLCRGFRLASTEARCCPSLLRAVQRQNSLHLSYTLR